MCNVIMLNESCKFLHADSVTHDRITSIYMTFYIQNTGQNFELPESEWYMFTSELNSELVRPV